MESLDKIVVFRLGKEEFGFSISRVISIERMKNITTVPQTAHYIRGIVEVREEVIPVIDLRKYMFDNPSIKEEDTNRIIVVRVENEMVGLVVDEAKDIVDLPADTIEKIALSGAKVNGPMDVAKIDERLVILMNIEGLLMNSDIAEALTELNKEL